jgi:hypothetical protein
MISSIIINSGTILNGGTITAGQILTVNTIQALHGIRSERQLMEQLNYNLLYRWLDCRRTIRCGT